MSFAVVIPARYGSSRLPGKPLLDIAGKPMIQRVWEQAHGAGASEVVIATDDKRIEEVAQGFGAQVCMTDPSHSSGTDRLQEVAAQRGWNDQQIVVNVQGDEPVIDPKTIGEIVSLYDDFSDEYNVFNLYKIIFDETQVNRNTIVKVIVNEKNEAMYFSRLPVPYSQSKLPPDFKQHIPIYGFTKYALDSFSSVGKTINEKYEDVELLRFLDLGIKIKVQETFADSISVDVPSDVEKVERFIKSKLEDS